MDMREVDRVKGELEAGFDEHAIPFHMREGVMQYVLRGRPVGGFLAAIFSNDLMEAAGRADEQNALAIGRYAKLIFNCVPLGSYGSQANYNSWIKQGGLVGYIKRLEEPKDGC